MKWFFRLGRVGLICFFIPVSTAYGITRDTLVTKKCGICHLPWLEAPEGKKVAPSDMEWDIGRIKEKLDIVVNEEICYECHDGFIMDSREKVWLGKAHSVGKRPSAKVRVPNNFPLDLDGEIYCGTCHSPHSGSDLSVEFAGKKFLRAEALDSLICKNCHVSQVVAPKVRNHPVDILGKNPIPGDIVRQGGSLGSDPRKIICQSCHSPHGKTTLVAGIRDSALCGVCHGEKLNSSRLSQNGIPTHPVNIKPEQDLRALPGFPEQARVGTGGEVVCSTCHSMHEGSGSSMLVVKDSAAFCYGCHENKVQTISGTKHDLSKTAPESRNIRGESPEQSGLCRTCHFAHGWAQKVSQTTGPISGACLACHHEGGWASKKQIGIFSHSVDVSLKSEVGKPPLPFWDHNGKPVVVCSTCHDPHKYGHGSAAHSQPLEIDGDPTNSFLRVQGKELCTECHADHGQLVKTKHDLRSFEKPIDKHYRTLLHDGGPCMGCHRVHNAKGAMLWFAELSPATRAFDQNEGTRRCLSCHSDEAMKRIQEKRGHPIGKEIPPQYMPNPPGALALGRIETEPGEGKALICTTCHVPHAEQTTEGTVTLFAGKGYPKQELCFICHGNTRSILGSPHDFRTRKAGAFVPDQGRSLAFGVCAGCHANHNSTADRKLVWFDIPSPHGKGNPEDMLCLYCHTDPRVIENRRTKFYVHPNSKEIQQIIGEKIKKGEIPPLAEAQIQKAQDSVSALGFESMFRVRCVTCHDNHRWIATPITQDRDIVASTEMASFLRGATVAQTICSQCHGLEALYRYRFFHQDRAFQMKLVNE